LAIGFVGLFGVSVMEGIIILSYFNTLIDAGQERSAAIIRACQIRLRPGFAFAAVAACVLWLLPPGRAVPLIMLLSACNQLLSLGALRREMVIRGTAEQEGALPYIVGGLAGVPIGLVLLRGLPTNLFTAALGVFLTVYSLACWPNPRTCVSASRAGRLPLWSGCWAACWAVLRPCPR
jgi:uncharacterized membrane protein YfcA